MKVSTIAENCWIDCSMKYARAPMLFPRRVEFDASSWAVKTSAAEASGTPLICCSCFLSSSVRTLPNSERAISSDFVTVPLVLLVRDVLPRAITDILGPLESAAVNHARTLIVLGKRAGDERVGSGGDEGEKCRDRRKQRRA